jgi:hypothetical protein
MRERADARRPYHNDITADRIERVYRHERRAFQTNGGKANPPQP